MIKYSGAFEISDTGPEALEGHSKLLKFFYTNYLTSGAFESLRHPRSTVAEVLEARWLSRVEATIVFLNKLVNLGCLREPQAPSKHGG
jgi:hypothetical protein